MTRTWFAPARRQAVVAYRSAGRLNAVRGNSDEGIKQLIASVRIGDELQAAFLRAKLPHLAGWTARRREVAAAYQAGLADLPGLTLPATAAGAEPVWHLYVVRAADREGLQTRLSESGVETLVHYPIPPHRSGAYVPMGLGPGRLPIAEALAAEVLSLPMGPHLTDAQVDHVIASVRAALAG